MHSSGDARGDAWLLTDNGFVGSYLRLERPERVTLVVRAHGHADAGAPRLELAVAGQTRPFDVSAEATEHAFDLDLGQGLHFVRVAYVNDLPNNSRDVTIHELRTTGGHWSNENSDANALAAANTVIAHYRRGPATIALAGAKPGDKVRISLDRHAFNFGTNIPYGENKLIPKETVPGSDAALYQKIVLDRFNTIVLSNGGKWVYHESKRDQVDLTYVDRFLDFAEQHRLRARMHTMLWDTEQQPDWVVSRDAKRPGLLTRAARGDDAATRELSAEIDERIHDYVRLRARRYQELDVLNESLHRPRYWQAYGTAGVASIFARTAAAVAEAGGHTRLFLNEYNLLQWSEHPLVGGADPYANWYRRHAEEILRAGGPLGGLGIQYYADGRSAAEIGESRHSPARIMQVLQNLSSTGLRLSLTEFAVNEGERARAAEILEDTLRLVFGTPHADSFLIWAIWESAAVPPPASALFDKRAERTVVGERFDALLANWDTELEATLGTGGKLAFTGYYGDYRVDAANGTGTFSLVRGKNDYTVALAPR